MSQEQNDSPKPQPSWQKRIVVSGHGAEALLTAYYVATNPYVRINKHMVYLIHPQSKRQEEELQIENPEEMKQRGFAFWKQYFKDQMSFRFYDWQGLNYVRCKLLGLCQKFDSSSSVNLKEQQDVKFKLSLDDKEIYLVNNEQQKSLKQVLKEDISNVEYIEGRTHAIFTFNDRISHVELAENPSTKSLRAQYFVLCSSFYLYNQLTESNLWHPLLRMSTELFSKTIDNNKTTHQFFKFMHGDASYFTLNNQSVVGLSSKKKNLFYNLGCQNPSFEQYETNAKILSELIGESVARQNNQYNEKESFVQNNPYSPANVKM